jgi:site-specific DNA-cytosine methylase
MTFIPVHTGTVTTAFGPKNYSNLQEVLEGSVVPVAVAPTLTAYNLDSRSPQSEEQQRIVRAVHDATLAVRRLTPRECERLMGWPDDWTRWAADGSEIADSHRYRMCGNGVASPVAEWVGSCIMEVQS